MTFKEIKVAYCGDEQILWNPEDNEIVLTAEK